MSESLQLWLQHAHAMADLADDISRRYFRQAHQQNIKADSSPVTQADLEIEETLRQYIGRHLSDHGIWGEEFGVQSGTTDYMWIIDPIDGTTAFTQGKPTFTTLIALYQNDEPLLGIISQAYLRERWIGSIHSLTLLNTQTCQTSSQTELNKARLSATTPQMFVTPQEQSCFAALRDASGVRSFGGDAYAFGLLAAGYIDVILEASLKYYDIAALIPIIEGAGGVISNWQGEPLNVNFKGQCLASANAELHQQALERVQKITPGI